MKSVSLGSTIFKNVQTSWSFIFYLEHFIFEFLFPPITPFYRVNQINQGQNRWDYFLRKKEIEKENHLRLYIFQLNHRILQRSFISKSSIGKNFNLKFSFAIQFRLLMLNFIIRLGAWCTVFTIKLKNNFKFWLQNHI